MRRRGTNGDSVRCGLLERREGQCCVWVASFADDPALHEQCIPLDGHGWAFVRAIPQGEANERAALEDADGVLHQTPALGCAVLPAHRAL